LDMQETSAKTRSAKSIAIVGRWLQVSRYDRASSVLLTLLIMVGCAAVLLFVVWLTGKIIVPPQVAVSPTLTSIARDGEDGGDGRAPGGSQLDTPSNEPVVGHDKKTSDVQENLDVLDVALVSKTAALDDLDALKPTRLGSQGAGGGLWGGDGPGRGPGFGDRPPGHRKNPDLPRSWEITFSSSTLDVYARQLDFFKIELAVVLPDDKIAYAYNLAKPKPDTRVGAAAAEKRFYLTWRSGELERADRELLARAGIDVSNHVIVKFLSPETEAQLAELEKRHAGADPKDIRRTRFGVRADGNGFKFYVMEQSIKR
jgi:hypothetical protein